MTFNIVFKIVASLSPAISPHQASDAIEDVQNFSIQKRFTGGKLPTYRQRF